MADYSTAAENALTNLEDAGLIEEYEISPRGRRVKRGKTKDQLATLRMMQGFAARDGGTGIFKLAKPANPET